MVLGSTDEEPVQIIPEAVDRSPLRVPTWAWGELREPRVVPLASNVLYYLVMLVSGLQTPALAQHSCIGISSAAKPYNADKQGPAA